MILLLLLVHITLAVVVQGSQLRLCRELHYDYVVSQAAIDEFGVSAGDAIGVDQQLVVRYDTMSQTLQGTPECLFHWKNLMCSHVFRTSNNAAACNSLCVSAAQACSAVRPNFCAAPNAASCTNYGELTGFCAAAVNISPTPPSPSPTTPRRSDCPTLTVTLSVFTVCLTVVLVHFLIN